MKRKVQLILMAMLLPFFNGTAQDTFTCVHDLMLEQQKQANPHLGDMPQLISYGAKRWRERNPNFVFYPKPQPAPPCSICMTIDPDCFKSRYALPVIVHIVAKPGDTTAGQGSNIPNSQVYNALAALNRQFAGYGIPDNHTVAVNTGIQFYLAPVGADSSGIIRYNSPLSSIPSGTLAPLRALMDSTLNTNEYIHIFVVDSIEKPGVMGYASYPETGFNHAVVVSRKRFGDASQACSQCQLHSQSRNKTLAHELGHFLGLRHTFQGGCAPDSADCEVQGDGCCDTPPVAAQNEQCPTGINSCPDNDPRPDQIENFMDYTSEACSKWFTRNQAERMYHVLETYKRELTDIENLITHQPNICMFSARFKMQNPVMCDTGNTVLFRALPYTNTGVNYIWTIYDSLQQTVHSATITDNHEWQYYMDEKGKYDVRLQVAYNSDTATEYIPQALWVVTCGAALSHEGGNWFFGNHAGLVFTEAGVRPSMELSFRAPNNMNANEGNVSISDKEGNLMFYASGRNHKIDRGVVYNSNHNATNNGNGEGFKMADNCAQPAVVFPYPNDTTKTLMLHSTVTYEGNLYYSILHKKSNGLYDTLFNYKNIPVTIAGIMQNKDNAIDAGENLTVVAKCYGVGYWLATTVRFDKNEEDYYLAIISIDTNGFQLVDTMLVPGFDGANLHYGQGKFSPDATKYATFNNIYNFDRATGKLTHLAELPFPNYLIYGLSFSPNSRYLYWIGENEGTTQNLIRRVDLSFNNPLSYIQDIGIAPNNASWQAMQLGPDNRLYIANIGSSELAVINHPDADWSKIHHNPLGYEPYGVPLQIGGMGGVSVMGLPNQIDAKRIEVIKDTIYYTIKDCNTVVFSSTACCRGSYLWMFGDGDTSMQPYPEPHTYAGVGVYHVKLVLDGTDTVRVTVPLFNPKVRISGDTLLCNENQYATYTALDIDSFSKNYQLHWEIKDGTYSLNYATSNTIEPVFDALPAQVIVHVTDPATECEARDTITVNQIAELATNKINNGIPAFASCSPAGTFSLEGNTPSGGGTFYYSWYYSYNNQDWVDMEQYTQNLTNQPLERTIYFKRLLYPDACYNWSNVVKVVPAIQGNDIFPLNPLYDERVCDPIFGGSLLTFLRSDTVVVYDDPAHSYYFKWQTSSNGYAWTDIAEYIDNQAYFWVDWRYSPRGIERRFDDHEPRKYIRKIVAASSYSSPFSYCSDTSNVLTITNYNIDSMRAIRFYAYDPDIIHGDIMLIEPDSLFRVVWQTSCNGTDWTDITAGFNHDTLWGVQSLGAEFVRRKIVKLTNQGFTYCDSLLSNVLECNPLTMQPVSQVVQIGEYATFYLDYSSADPFAIQWQQYNPSTSSWDNIAGATSAELRIHANKCNDDTLFRALITNACRSLITDSVALHVVNNHSDFFLWLKDLPSDTAREPNIEVSAKNNYFGSPDIAASNTVTVVNGRLTMITVLDRELDLYVTVRNKGADTSGGGELYLYASLSGLNPEWDFSFMDIPTVIALSPSRVVSNYNIFGNPPIFGTEGTPVNSEGIPIPDIPPGDSVRIHYRWTNPPEHFVQHYFSRSGSVYPTSNAVIYLARITECSSYPFEMSYPEVIFSSTSVQGTAKVNIKQNAKVAALHCYTLPVHNDAVSPFNSSQMQPDIITMVSSKMVLPVDIGVDVDSANAFFDNAEMYVFFDDVLWDAFVAGGNIGGGYTIVEDGVFRVSNYGAVFWSNMFLDTGVVGHAGFSFYYKTGEDTSGALINNKFRVFLTEDSQEQGSLSLYVDSKLKGINGGQTMMIPAQPRDAADKRIAGTQSHAKESAIASPLPTQERDPTTDEFMFSFRPNPFSRELFVRVSNAEPAAVISLSYMNGKVVYEHVISGESRAPYYEFTIPAQAFAEGVYLLSYQSPTRKAVKKAVLLR
ncbi:MAG: hypothetical protein KF882_04300 [Bacteroidia bacterium]|nr:hypothetical protein [Bacteroidia bacterium]MCO5254794.1 M43 family zinc metalloprotease [Bacteroidota bacterium]